jgi:hypothetical protein
MTPPTKIGPFLQRNGHEPVSACIVSSLQLKQVSHLFQVYKEVLSSTVNAFNHLKEQSKNVSKKKFLKKQWFSSTLEFQSKMLFFLTLRKA